MINVGVIGWGCLRARLGSWVREGFMWQVSPAGQYVMSNVIAHGTEREQLYYFSIFFFQAEDGIRDYKVTGVQTCALPISPAAAPCSLRCRTYASCLVHECLGSPPSLGAGRRLGDQPDDRLGVRRSHVEPAIRPSQAQAVLRVGGRVRKPPAQGGINVIQPPFRVPRSAFQLRFDDRVARRGRDELADP